MDSTDLLLCLYVSSCLWYCCCYVSFVLFAFLVMLVILYVCLVLLFFKCFLFVCLFCFRFCLLFCLWYFGLLCVWRVFVLFCVYVCVCACVHACFFLLLLFVGCCLLFVFVFLWVLSASLNKIFPTLFVCFCFFCFVFVFNYYTGHLFSFLLLTIKYTHFR